MPSGPSRPGPSRGAEPRWRRPSRALPTARSSAPAREAALDAYAGHEEPASIGLEPLTIEVTRDEAGLRFGLSDSAARRLLGAGVDRSPSKRALSVAFDVKSAFEQTHGSIYPYVAEWLTGLSREALVELGAARFVEGERVLLVWPARA